tara:strand:+ start:79 stop:249 length:171 start_codon:yes stop_codon:yes gene_type:complete
MEQYHMRNRSEINLPIRKNSNWGSKLDDTAVAFETDKWSLLHRDQTRRNQRTGNRG